MQIPHLFGRRFRRLVLLLCAQALCFQGIGSAQGREEARTFRLVEELHREIEAVRLEVGRPEHPTPATQVLRASPRDLYAQGLGLTERVQRLSAELIRDRGPKLAQLEREAQWSDVQDLLKSIVQRMKTIRTGIGIVADLPVPELDPTQALATTSTEIFVSMVRASRQLNLLLSTPIQPRDVLAQVSLALAYADMICESSGIELREDPPPFIPQKLPTDVYAQLNLCLNSTRRIALAMSDGKVQVQGDQNRTGEIVPGDVFDVTLLLVHDLRHLASLKGSRQRLDARAVPGRVYPSHVHQRARHLSRTLQDLEAIYPALPSQQRTR